MSRVAAFAAGTPSVRLGVHAAFFLAGCALQGLAYGSVVAIGFGPAVVLAAGIAVTLWDAVTRSGGAVLAAFVRLFCVGWFMAGIAAAYAQWLHDPFQLGSDAFGFFQLASGAASGLSLDDIRELSEGAGAVVVWRAWYDLAAALGVDRMRFVGIGLNTLLVASSAALALRTAALMFGSDARRQERLLLLFSSCGLLWMFAATHLRDSAVLLAVTLTTHAWVWYLTRGTVWRALWLGLVLVLLTAAFAVLRTEFAFVPLVASAIGLLAMAAAPPVSANRGRRWIALGMLAAGAVAAAGYFGLALEAVEVGSQTYRGLVDDEASQSSLGAQLVVNQPMPIRAVVGAAYVLAFPIPVWSGLASDSVLHLFKSLSALFFYALVPLLGVAVVELWRKPALRSTDRLFALGLCSTFLVAIAMTSLESRHFGSFLASVFLVALVPDLRDPAIRRRYAKALFAMVSAMIVVHLLWAALKVVPG